MTIIECEAVSLPPSVEKAIARLAGCGFFEYGLIGGSWCFPFYDAVIGVKYPFFILLSNRSARTAESAEIQQKHAEKH
jgi:hypothetical protein